MALHIENQAHFEQVLAFADKVGLRHQLDEQLEFLGTYAQHDGRDRTRCRLFKDFAPYSFEFLMEIRDGEDQYRRWFVGGLIFHGPHDNGGDGGFPTLAVSLTPTTGWSVHT